MYKDLNFIILYFKIDLICMFIKWWNGVIYKFIFYMKYDYIFFYYGCVKIEKIIFY